jgi:outer membrane protein assembly factor BamB
MFASPILHRESIIAASREGWLQAFSTRSGELKWQKNCQRRLEATPQIVHDQLFAGTLEGELVAFALPS